jgi:hypothetical protein
MTHALGDQVMSKKITVDAALNAIAAHFTFNQTVRTGEGDVEKNQLAFIQKRVLNGLCTSAAFTLSDNRRSFDEAKDRIAQATRAHRGDELSDQTLNRAVDWAERLELQIAMLEGFLDVAARTYETYTGETYVEPPRKVAPRKEFTTAATERAARFTGLSTEVQQIKTA